MKRKVVLAVLAMTLFPAAAHANPWQGALTVVNRDSQPYTIIIDKERRYIHVSNRPPRRQHDVVFPVAPSQDVAIALDHGDWILFGDHADRNSLQVTIRGRQNYQLVLEPFYCGNEMGLLGDFHDGYRQVSVRLFQAARIPVVGVDPPPPPYYGNPGYAPPPGGPVPVIGGQPPPPYGGPIPVVGDPPPHQGPGYDAGYDLGRNFAGFLDDLLHRN